MRPGDVILAFHQTSNRFYPGINNLKPGYFFALLDLLTSLGSLPDSQTSSNAPTKSLPRVIFSFDDGYAENFDIIASLCERDIKPLLFIPTAFIGKSNEWDYSSRFFPARHLTKKQLAKLSDLGAIIGSHGISHKSLIGMTDRLLREELEGSRKCLEDITGSEVKYISYPFGRVNSKVEDAARSCGYEQGFTLNGGLLPDKKNIFSLPRTAIYGFDDYFSIINKVSAESKFERFKNRVVNRLASGTIILSDSLN